MGKNSYIPSGKLEFINSDKQISFDTLEKKNNLYACLSVKTGIGVCTGWKKKVRMLLIWKIITSKGYTVKIKTDCISKDKYGMMPNTDDPKLEPVWIELSKENTKQFLVKLAEIMKKDKNMQ